MRLAPLALALLGAAAAAQTAAPGPLPEAAAAYGRLVEDGDLGALEDRWDADGFAARIADGLALSEADAAEIRRGLQRGSTLYENLVNGVLDGGSYRFLRVVEREGEARARFRMVDAGGGLNYHDLLLVPGPDGTYRLVDGYDFMNGEDFSRSVQRIVTGMMDGAPLFGGLSERGEHVRDFGAALRRGDFGRALDLYPRIPPRSVDRKPLLMLFLRAAGASDADRYRKGLEHFARDFGADPGAALLLIDHHTFRGDVEAALAAVDTLEADVGGDPYLDDLRVSLWLLEGRAEEASAAADRLVAALPDLPDAHYARLDLDLATGDYESVAAGLLHLEREFGVGYDPVILKADPAWAGFVASPAYKRWEQGRR